jgi:hypothetical protein
MRHTRHLFESVAIAALVSGCIGLSRPALAQSTPMPTGGSAVLPAPEPRFGGIIGRKASESKPDFPQAVTAPKGAPNVLLILTTTPASGQPVPSAARSRHRPWIGWQRVAFVGYNRRGFARTT